MNRKIGLVIGTMLCGAGLPAHGQEREPPVEVPDPTPGDIIVYGRAIEQIGTARSASEGVVGYRDFADRPLSRVGELVENIPGVIATQHSGTGKANQYFLRGFNLDHGTDFAAYVDGVPVNMRSHGHGQGYLDLNFLIPELVQRIDYRKGPYFADDGDFSAAGSARFVTADTLAPFAEVTGGSFGYLRGLAAGSGPVGGGDVLIGVEGVTTNGPWALDEDLAKINGFAKFTSGAGPDATRISVSGYHASWTSTDQVPVRAIESGRIDRFGFIDPDLGGRTTRIAVSGSGRAGGVDLSAYALYYDFALTSNFTYFLDDPVNGDQFQQRDRRWVAGGAARHQFADQVSAVPVRFQIGADWRYDHITNVGLYRATAGEIREPVREDGIDQLSAALFASAEVKLAPRLRLSLGLRGDLYRYDVAASLSANSDDGWDALVAPKLALAWSPVDTVELYANYGEGFHSNDARGAAIRVDPVTGDPVDRVPLLVRARGAELGTRIEVDRFTLTLAAFYLGLESELVFVGDGGATEPNPPSRRFGGEAVLFWRPANWLTLDGSAAYTNARFRAVPSGQRDIPGAVPTVISGGAAIQLSEQFSATARVRHFGGAPLIEDASAKSRSTTLVNVGGYYRLGRARLGLELLNLFDARDADVTYFYASQLPGEAEPVDDIHLHPVEPFTARISARLSF
ncbi:TonB-dependent receptor [Sphingomonas sp. CJ99]